MNVERERVGVCMCMWVGQILATGVGEDRCMSKPSVVYDSLSLSLSLSLALSLALSLSLSLSLARALSVSLSLCLSVSLSSERPRACVYECLCAEEGERAQYLCNYLLDTR
jgi:hypothetical protein